MGLRILEWVLDQSEHCRRSVQMWTKILGNIVAWDMLCKCGYVDDLLVGTCFVIVGNSLNLSHQHRHINSCAQLQKVSIQLPVTNVGKICLVFVEKYFLTFMCILDLKLLWNTYVDDITVFYNSCKKKAEISYIKST